MPTVLQPLHKKTNTEREKVLGVASREVGGTVGVHVNGGSGTAGEENANWCAIECAFVMSCISPRGHN